MIFAGICLSVLTVLCCGSSANCVLRTIQQPVDHFVESSPHKTLEYYACGEHYVAGGPIFLYTAVGKSDSAVNSTGLMWEFGKEMGAFLIFAESSGSVISQILADYANLIVEINGEYKFPKSTAVITFGVGYGGQFAAWMRSKYPHLVEGAVASGAPLFPTSLEFYESTFVAAAGSACIDRLRAAFRIIEQWDVQHLIKVLGIEGDVLNWAARPWGYLAMRNYPYATDNLPPNPLISACAILTRHASDVSDLGILNSLAASLKDVHQEHTEDVWAESVNIEAVLGNDKFRKKHETNLDTEFGISNPVDTIAAMSNTIWSNGELDPWGTYAGVHCVGDDDAPPSGVALYDCPVSVLAPTVPGGVHGSDFQFTNPLDSSELTNIRRLETAHISAWIEAKTLRYAHVEPQNVQLPNLRLLVVV